MSDTTFEPGRIVSPPVSAVPTATLSVTVERLPVSQVEASANG